MQEVMHIVELGYSKTRIILCKRDKISVSEI